MHWLKLSRCKKVLSIKGKLDADLTLNCKLSSLRNQDIGRIRMLGKLQLNDFVIRDEQKSFDFESSASFTFQWRQDSPSRGRDTSIDAEESGAFFDHRASLGQGNLDQSSRYYPGGIHAVLAES